MLNSYNIRIPTYRTRIKLFYMNVYTYIKNVLKQYV